MRAPAFWQSQGWLSTVLLPLSGLYHAGQRLRALAHEVASFTVPIICVGNVVAGGAGKTPTAIAIAAELMRMGKRVHLLTRGYGGSLPGPLQVDPARHNALEVGDEPLLLARQFPTWVAWERKRGAEAAIKAGAEVIVMDDGLQNPTIAKTLSLVVIDGGYGFGNGRLIPAGPLREPINAALTKAQAVVLIGGDEKGIAAHIPPSLPVLQAHALPQEGIKLAGKQVIAFAGIARPEKFFATVNGLGATIIDTIPFPDHHYFMPAELADLRERAAKTNATLVTTEKDWVRLPESMRGDTLTVPLHLTFQNASALTALLQGAFGAA